MSYSGDMYSSSSYRKIFGDAPRRVTVGSTSSPSRVTVHGYRSGSQHPRTYASPPSVVTSSSYRTKLASGRGGFQYTPENLDLTQTTAITNELKIIRTNEKEQLQGLNDRFVTFIEKVHNLEQHNKVLEAEVALLRQRHNEPSRLHDLYEQEVRELRARVEDLTHEKNQMHLDCVQMNDALERLREKLDEETRLREEAENSLKGYRKDVDDATLSRLELEKKVESLLDEIAFLRKVHEEELQELQASIQATQVSVEMDVSKPDLAVALKDIRAQYESLSSRNQLQAEEWYRSKFVTVTEAAARNNDALKQTKDELSDYRRQLQSRTLEIESLKAHNESLERQLAEMEDRHSNEIGELQDTIQQLESALRSTKGEMSRHLREYQDLLNVKMALDIEIAAYRKLLEGEECRLSTVGGAMMQSAFSYPSSRTYVMSTYRKGGAKPAEEEEEEGEEEEAEEEAGEEAEEEADEQEGGEEEEEEEEQEEEKEKEDKKKEKEEKKDQKEPKETEKKKEKEAEKKSESKSDSNKGDSKGEKGDDKGEKSAPAKSK
ncbi:low molecular weight neuronal intermediate filament [Misgurnus anguillicaudatus]|uniref:low molecular weight neuronal intermediate filament n=1 Tax=Misgurnus anguillicaudatus TaxID=75329 RepID=UPI002435F264|nr:low molecular weight neuronal intermediate filament [Misgurnus anguillicaudatus]